MNPEMVEYKPPRPRYEVRTTGADRSVHIVYDNRSDFTVARYRCKKTAVGMAEKLNERTK